MQKKRILLNVKRYKQKPAECAIAAAASLANYYDSSVEYSNLRQMIPYSKRKDGIFSSQQGRLLNELGFSCVTIVTADLSLIDFSWRRFSKLTLIKNLKTLGNLLW